MLQRFVLLGQRPLDPHAVGDVDEGQHRLRIRQRDDGEIEDQPGAAVRACPGRSGSLVVETGDEMREPLPAVRLVIGRRAGLLDGADMRARLGFGLA